MTNIVHVTRAVRELPLQRIRLLTVYVDTHDKLLRIVSKLSYHSFYVRRGMI